MAYLTLQELSTHLHDEQVETITRGDNTIAEAAIDAAIAEARGYLTRFDTARTFSASGSKRNQLLLIFVKDIAVWHLINLCNAGSELPLRQDRYERAVDWLKAVQRGDVSPDLPSKEPEGGKAEKNNPIGPVAYGSNPKRTQHY
ncbi:MULTISPECIES: phage protein Gp36 family protein [Parabacteroides]|uniref:Mu-like prophage protein gp36 n=1 Tax=Parabacteroides chinchillae TaxID=871327 RepID=A0A8G2BWV8_9BACT|nr:MULTISPECIES: phage protein Gp36 family protein [Parabacteroides]SEF86377.1 Protein of unknown function [Parabacteroides chinchillae]